MSLCSASSPAMPLQNLVENMRPERSTMDEKAMLEVYRRYDGDDAKTSEEGTLAQQPQQLARSSDVGHAKGGELPPTHKNGFTGAVLSDLYGLP